MQLGVEVNLGLGDVVLDGFAAPPPPKRSTAPSVFIACLLWPNGCMDEDATWYVSRPRPRKGHGERGRFRNPQKSKFAKKCGF